MWTDGTRARRGEQEGALVGARPDSRLERGFEADFVHAGVTLTRRTRCAAGPGRAGGHEGGPAPHRSADRWRIGTATKILQLDRQQMRVVLAVGLCALI